jgi:hypothetical protein
VGFGTGLSRGNDTAAARQHWRCIRLSGGFGVPVA